MQTLCHRCGGDLPVRDGSTSFCPHCGAPQLYLLEHLLEDGPAIGTTGAPPPPSMRQIDWQAALRAAALVGLVATLLCIVAVRVQVFTLLSWLWIVSSSVVAIGLYQRQRPAAFMDARTGAHIGLVVGLLTTFALALTLAVAGTISRFALHDMGNVDAAMSAMIHTMIGQFEAQAAGQPDAKAVIPHVVGIYLSPEFPAALMLLGGGLVTGMLLAVSTIGGAIAGFIRTRTRALL